MHCARIRTALSARLDGEQLPPGVTDRQNFATVDSARPPSRERSGVRFEGD